MREDKNALKCLGSCENGSTVVEFAIIGMLLIAGSLIAIDFGRAFYLYNKTSNAMDRAVRQSLVLNSSNDQLIAEIMKDFPNPGNPEASETPKVTITDDAGFRTVKANLTFKPAVPAFVGNTFTMSLTRRFPKEL